MEGWIKQHRKSLESSIWADPIIWYVWCWCLFKASHTGNKFPFNGEDIELEPGQFVTGRVKALQEVHTTESRYKRAIDYLKSSNRISSKSTNKYTIITVLNWKYYQTDIQQNVQQPAQQTYNKHTQSIMHKNVKNNIYTSNLKKETPEFTIQDPESWKPGTMARREK